MHGSPRSQGASRDAELVLRKDGEFRARRLSELSIVFQKGDSGSVVEAVVTQGPIPLHAA